VLAWAMDRAMLEGNLAQVERDLRAASEDIAHQHETLRNLVRHGEDTTQALRSIGILEHAHLVLSSLRDQLAASWLPSINGRATGRFRLVSSSSTRSRRSFRSCRRSGRSRETCSGCA
jgi:hypothetical protein